MRHAHRLRSAVRTASLLAVFALLLAASAAADVRDFLGRTITDVRIEMGGLPFADRSVLQLIETRVGDVLSMQQVRESVDHLVGVGRFEDIRVYAAPSPPPTEGVTLRWVLVPVQRIAEIDLDGRSALAEDVVRAEVAEVIGTLPVTTRVDEIVDTVRTLYAERGYRRPVIEPRLVPGPVPELARLRLDIDAGPRTTIGDISVRGDTGLSSAAVIDELRLERGRLYDRPAIEARVVEFEDSLRDLGYYEASVDVSASFNDETATADLTVEANRGPRVRVVFAGDALPDNRRDTLVPIRQERSIDLDLLEDASRNIEAFLRQLGYRNAEAPYVREEKNGEMTLTFTVRRGPLHRLSSIDVAGNVALPRGDLVPLLALQPGEPFSESRVATVASAITELYRVRGFARAIVRPEVTLAPSGDTASASSDTHTAEVPVTVRLVVTEGVPTVVGNVTIQGNVEVAEEKLRELLRLVEQRPYYRPRLDADRDEIERRYRNAGFRDVRAEANVTLQADGEHVDVRWTIVEGPRIVVDRILVSGNARTSDDLIRREVALTPGSPLGDDAIIESQRRLAALGLFRRVRIVELPHAGGLTRDILIEVEEAPATTIAYGGGLEAGRRLRTGDNDQVEERIDVAPRGFFQISRRNLWGKNRSISVFTRVSFRPRDPGVESDPAEMGGYGFNEYRVVGTFREPRLFNRPGDLQLTGFVEQAIRSSFNFWRQGVRVDYARQVRSNLTVSGRYALDRTRLFDVHIEPEDQLPVDRLFPQVRLSTVMGSVARDTRDDVIDPARGALVGADTTLALRWLGSEVGFAKTSLYGFIYRRLPGSTPWTVAAGVRLGLAEGFPRTVDGTVVEDVPASERFFAGGDSTVRGFVLDRLGMPETVNDQGYPAGGNGLTVVNLELRSPYWKGLGGVGFFDAGNVFRLASDIRVQDFRPAAGFGVRYRSPLGPLRFDVGFNLDPQLLPTGARERGAVFHLSLGQAF
jgi:outer membrane protein assembly complex protein YaeT